MQCTHAEDYNQGLFFKNINASQKYRGTVPDTIIYAGIKFIQYANTKNGKII